MYTRETGQKLVVDLVEKFHKNRHEFIRSGSTYNETQLRNDYLNRFLQALGWDVFNDRGFSQHLREVIQEQVVEEDEGDTTWKKPDYTLRFRGKRRFFVEAKKPSVNIESLKQPAFQLRRYGWSAKLPISILTNFEKLAIYDCRFTPDPSDDAKIARLKVYDYTEYADKFDEIHDQISRESVHSGVFDQIFEIDEERVGTQYFDGFFLAQIEKWRETLAKDIALQNPQLSSQELNFLVQQIINRIIFLRICEDRELEKYKNLESVKEYDALKQMFIDADKKYNSDLFDFVEDKLSMEISIDSGAIVGIFKELYYPNSPYIFSVVDSNILGQIYELFLGKEIVVDNEKNVEIIEKPEVLESKGVIPTPEFIVDSIVRRTLESLCDGKSPTEISTIRIADIACGSGMFLLSAFDFLMNWHLEWYIMDGVEKHQGKLYRSNDGWTLSLSEKERILLNNIYGVDIDAQAVEVTRFGLLLKILENETSATIDAFLEKTGDKALPKLNYNIQLGNSLVDHGYFEYDKAAVKSTELVEKIKPFSWENSLGTVMDEGGLDLVIGNPPYIRIQNMEKYSPEEVRYYRSKSSPYESKRGNIDKYYLFLERGIHLLKESGYLGYIVPHKFFVLKSAKNLRRLISSGKYVKEIVHFHAQQVFGKKTTTYTCIFIQSKRGEDQFEVEHVTDIRDWRLGKGCESRTHSANVLSEKPWVFVAPRVKDLFERIKKENPTKLEDVCSVFVGLQTSADRIYLLTPIDEDEQYALFTDLKGDAEDVEKSILRPLLLDLELEPFGKPKPNAYIIFPYKIQDNKAVLYSMEEMETRFPKCWKYLNKHKQLLIPPNRDVSGYTEDSWYRFGRSQSLTKFDGEPKLIWPVLSREPCYVYDDSNILITGGGNGPYYALKMKSKTDLSLYYIQSVLSHPVIEALVKPSSSVFRGDYYSHGKQFIQRIPIPRIEFTEEKQKEKHDEIVELAKQLTQAVLDEKNATNPHQRDVYTRQKLALKSKVDSLVGELYVVTEQDLKEIESLSY